MAARQNGLKTEGIDRHHDEPSTASEPSTADDVETDDEDEEEEDEEPKLKYDRLTGYLGSVYRGGDATSSFLVGGDKMVIGTHNGNINVLSLPSFQSLRFYHAHSASVTTVSVSPFPIPYPEARFDAQPRPMAEEPRSPDARRKPSVDTNASTATRTPRPQPTVPATPSNSIYIATSSIDGNVCVQSLVDVKDVSFRNFRRPVQAVAISPDYRNDRTYLSGGLAGSLIMTQGAPTGAPSEANTNSAAAAASGWLGSIGLGSNTGKDTVLHSGEGSISTIKWSLSGKFVAWVNEHGIKIMRTNVRLDNLDSESAWKRIGHADRPTHGAWDDMASVWKPKMEWVNEKHLEQDEEDPAQNGSQQSVVSTKESSENLNGNGRNGVRRKKSRVEKLVVGWGDTAWVIQVDPGGAGVGKEIGERSVGRADIVQKLRFDDCIISGLSFYTPSLLLVLAYRTIDDNDQPVVAEPQTTPRKGVHHRRNGLQPELRLIDASTSNEVDVDTLTISRFETLSAADYHLSTLFVPTIQAGTPAQRGALEAIGEGLLDVGSQARRIFNSGASVISFASSGENAKATLSSANASQETTRSRAQGPQGSISTPGLKIFIHSPYDCVLAVKRDLADHLTWLLQHEDYETAWKLVTEHPEVVTATPEKGDESSPSTPSRQQTMADFFADDASQTTLSVSRLHNSTVDKEKRRIGDLWIQQLVNAKDWETAGQVAGRVLGTSSRWEYWVWTFAQAGRFDDITPYIPTKQLHPPLPSLVYEYVLGNYIKRDPVRFKELLNQWDPELFDINAVTTAVEAKLDSGDVREDTVEGGERGRDWRILLNALAKLYLADGRPKEALKCHFRLQNADAAMAIIRDYHLLAAVSDDIPGFIMLRVSKEQLKSAPLDELEEASSQAVHLLIDEAYEGIVHPEVVVEQLQAKGMAYKPFLFLYLRALWRGEGTETEFGTGHDRIAAEGKTLVEDFADLAVEMYAEYDRPLLMEFLKSSKRYDFEKACQICESREYILESVYILSIMGRTKQALFLIIDKLADVSRAIAFAKEQDDPDLWNDLLDYSMDKPRFIRGLLEEVGTAIDPITLVRRIPEGLEIEGLRDGIRRMVREYEIQFSISDGVAKVLRSEVATAMEALRAGRKRAVKFEVVSKEEDHVDVFVEPQLATKTTKREEAAEEARPAMPTAAPDHSHPGRNVPPGHCVGCARSFSEHGTTPQKETLVGFACGHVYHLSCLLSSSSSSSAEAASDLQARFAADAEGGFTGRSVGAKVAHAHLIRSAIDGGCPVCSEISED
ncbi:vacuolar assembly protein-like protein [Saccharata proteae CBS 121410]|uniref:Vacuolar assembly protein-like protein n=1 Tax=Saccharata proteae CBS 121410 TaxID=1314787 RepID=A0A9P4HRG4_9PEZI|nr:vacuolar assembly protein-like protein [Saccharata proteae CBS 121410]